MQKPFQISLNTHGCCLPFHTNIKKYSVCFQGHQEKNKNVLLSRYHRQETCTWHLNMGGATNTIKSSIFFIQEHFEDSKHYVLLNRWSRKTNIKKSK